MKKFAVALVVALFTFGLAHAQTALVVTEAELAVPFGAAKGQLALVGNQILFVASDMPDASMSIDRADIAKVDRSGDVVTITTRRALRDADGERNTFRFRLSQPADVMSWYQAAATAVPAPTTAAAVLASFQVKHDHRIGSCEGTLILTNERVSFESNNQRDDSRQWQLVDIKEVEQDGAYKFKVVPFRDDSFKFELTGKGMDSGEYRRLVDRIARARSTY